jgi:hypothetical protein
VTPAIGPWNGISDTLSAIDEPIIAAICGEQSGSALNTMFIMGYIDGKYIINPTVEEKEVSRLDLEVAGHKDAVNPTFTPAIGPWNGISDTLSAIDEPIIAAICGEQSGSALNTNSRRKRSFSFRP